MAAHFAFLVQLDENDFQDLLNINDNTSLTILPTLGFAIIYLSFERQINHSVYNNLKQMPQSKMLLLLLLLLFLNSMTGNPLYYETL